MRGVIQSSCCGDRRHHHYAAELRRRAWFGGCVAVGELAGAGFDSGDARSRRQDDDRLPARQLLRQDVDLQQPEAVWNSLLVDAAAYGGARLGGFPGRPGVVLGCMPGGAWVEKRSPRCDWCSSDSVQYSALLGEAAGAVGHYGRDTGPE